MAKKESTAVAKIVNQFPILSGEDISAMTEVMEENLSGLELTPNDLEIIKFPSGGAIAWEVEGDDGEADYVKEFEAIILHIQPVRAFWEKSIDEAGSGHAPDCYSRDAVHGEGAPSDTAQGLCRNCELSRFTEDEDGNSVPPRCKEMRLVFVLRPGKVLPSVVRVPPTSLRVITAYMRQLVSAATPRTGTVTTFKLEKAQNADGVDYAKLVCSTSKDARLSPEQRQIVKAYIDGISAVVSEFAARPDAVVD